MSANQVRQSISRRLLLYLVLCFVVPFTLGAFYINMYFLDTLKAEELQNAKLVLDQAGLYLEDSVLMEMQSVLQTVSTDHRVLEGAEALRNYTVFDPAAAPQAETAAEKDLMDYFATLKAAYGTIDFLFLGVEDGTYAEFPAFKPSKPYDPRTRPWYLAAQDTSGTIISDPYLTQVTQELVFSVTRQLKLPSGRKAVAGMTVSLKQVADLVSRQTKPGHLQYMMVLDSDNHFVASDLGTDLVLKKPEDLGMQAVADALAQPGVAQVGAVNGERYLITAITTPRFGWKIVSLRSLSEITEQAKAVTFFVSVVVGCLLMAALLVMRLIILRAIGDLHNIVEAIHRVGDPAFDTDRVLKDIGRREDEVGLISRAVAQLVSALREIAVLSGYGHDVLETVQTPREDGVDSLTLRALEHSRQDHQRLASISEQLSHSEDALSRVRERLLVAFEIANDAFFDWNPATGVLYLNQRLRQWIAPTDTAEALSYTQMRAAIHPEDIPAFDAEIDRLLKGEGLAYELEYRLLTESGQVLWLHGKGRTLETAPDGTVARIMGICTDITAQKLVEEQLRRINDDLELKVSERTQELTALNQELQDMNLNMLAINSSLQREIRERKGAEEQLSQANGELSTMLQNLQAAQRQLLQSEKLASLSTLVTGVAHEVNTPLGVSVTAASYLKRLNDEVLDALAAGGDSLPLLNGYVTDSREAADIVLSNLQRAARLISTFKNLSVDQSSDVCRRFAVRAYVEEILFSLKPQMKQSNPEIILRIDETLSLLGYPGAFAQILTNLVVNAIIHGFDSQPGGHLTIDGGALEGGILLSVTDDGAGMTEDTLTRIFDPFFTTRRGVGGSGLGLFLVHNLVEQQFGGRITCTSTPGEGTTFLLHLYEQPAGMALEADRI